MADQNDEDDDEEVYYDYNTEETESVREENPTIDIVDVVIDEEDDNEKEFIKISIHNERFVKILNKTFLVFISIGIFLLIMTIMSYYANHELYPFKTQKISHWSTQIGYGIFFASYWTINVMALRILVILGYAFFTLSLFLTSLIPYMDIILWTYVFVMINTQQIIKLIYKSRPIVFDSFREKVYKSIFEGIMDRADFKILTKNSVLRDISSGRYYATVGDRCSNLSILISGNMRVLKSKKDADNNIIIDTLSLYEELRSSTISINEGEFIDSSQWMLRNSTVKRGSRFTYSIVAQTDCKYMTWSREILCELLSKNKEIEQPLMGALGLDVSHKVLMLQDE